jgi:hypothetical protein
MESSWRGCCALGGMESRDMTPRGGILEKHPQEMEICARGHVKGVSWWVKVSQSGIGHRVAVAVHPSLSVTVADIVTVA